MRVDYVEGSPGMDPRFRRMYCSLAPLKEGFLSACRPLICLDGYFLKGPYPGQLLSAVGVDAKNGICPISKENKKTWGWFVELLCKDTRINNQFDYTLMSDQQKITISNLRV